MDVSTGRDLVTQLAVYGKDSIPAIEGLTIETRHL